MPQVERDSATEASNDNATTAEGAPRGPRRWTKDENATVVAAIEERSIEAVPWGERSFNEKTLRRSVHIDERLTVTGERSETPPPASSTLTSGTAIRRTLSGPERKLRGRNSKEKMGGTTRR